MNAIVVSSAWLGGIFAGSLYRAPMEMCLLGILLFGGLALIWWPLRGVRLSAIFALVVLVGVLRSGAHLDSVTRTAHSLPAGASPALIQGVVVGEPEPRDRVTHLLLDITRSSSDQWEPASGKVLVRVARYPEFKYGDVLILTGRLQEPRSFDDFDYREYLAQRGIYWVMDFPQVRKTGSDEGTAGLRLIYNLREALTNALAGSLPEPQSSLAAGVLLGIRTTIPDDLIEAFSKTGTYHILAVSGLNISLVCGLLAVIGQRLWNRRYNAVFLLAGIAAYSALVGPQPSVLRASIMGALLVIAHHLGRPTDTISWLLIAASTMTAFDPSLLQDTGFQLSFSATAGLALLAPVLQVHLSAIPRWLGDSISVTLAAQIATLPITALNFGQLSLVTPLANLLVVPAVLPLMVGSAVTASLGMLFEPGGQLAGWITWLVATYVVLVVEHLGRLPWASLSLGKFGVLPTLPYYAFLALALLGTGNRALGLGWAWTSTMRRVPTRWMYGTLGIAAVVVWAGALTVPNNPTTVSFLDVGQGDATLIQTATGRRVLVDGGPSPSTIANTLGRRLPFWDRTIDLVVLTHANEDHLAGLIDVIERHDVRLVLEPALPHSSASYIRWLEAIRRKGIRTVAAVAGQEIALDDRTRLIVLHPGTTPPEGSRVDLNEYSVVLKFVAGNVAALLAGDAGQQAQREMLASGRDLSATILKVPHHGAPDSLLPGFLVAVQPKIAVVSVGANNRFGHPALETLRELEGIKVYRTDLNGTVEVSIDAAGYRVRPALSQASGLRPNPTETAGLEIHPSAPP